MLHNLCVKSRRYTGRTEISPAAHLVFDKFIVTSGTLSDALLDVVEIDE